MKPALKLSAHSVKRLKKLYKYDQSGRVRVRSHTILLYRQGFNYTQIAEVLMEHKDSTVSLWINNFSTMGFDALYDQKREIHPNATFTETDKKTHRLAGQRKGQRILLPSKRSENQTVLGFVNKQLKN